MQFTLYELRKELKRRGHDIHLHDLITSLLICRRTNITSKQDDGSEVFMDSSIFPTLVITKRRIVEVVLGERSVAVFGFGALVK